jgi:hypothetical protein
MLRTTRPAFHHRRVGGAALSAVLAGSALLVGCGDAAERLATSATERVVESALGDDAQVTLDGDGDQITIEGGDGQSLSLGAATEVPERIARVVPLPDAFAPATAQETVANGQRSATVLGHLADADPIEVLAALETQLAAEGWTVEQRSDIGGQLLSLQLLRDDEALLLNLVSDGQETALTVTHTAAD